MYEYVVVGAGSAGSVLAARLSEDPDSRVLLLEAGPPDTAPQMRGAGPGVGAVGAGALRVGQRHRCAAARRQPEHPWPSGRTLGGSSSINAMMYVRGNPADYDTWRDSYGCDGWGYADLLPYFRDAEDQQHGASPFHGAGGPLRVEDPRRQHPLAQAWVAAAQASGLAARDDFNGASQDGVGFYQLTQHRGERCSAADAYLRPARGRGNLTAVTGALVTSRGVRARRPAARPRAAPQLGPTLGRDHLPPHQHLRHGRPRQRSLRPPATRTRRGWAAGSRRTGDAGHPARQHTPLRPEHI